METPERKTIGEDHRETLVEAARRFIALHPDVQAVAITVVSRVVNPDVLSTTVVGQGGPPRTPDTWLLGSLRLMEGAEFCNENAKGLIMGLDDLANNLARTVEGLRDEQRRIGEEKETRGIPEEGGEENDGDV